jgi:hypothetical protein
VVAGCLIKALLRSIEASKKSSAGDGKPALIPLVIKGKFNTVTVDVE